MAKRKKCRKNKNRRNKNRRNKTKKTRFKRQDMCLLQNRIDQIIAALDKGIELDPENAERRWLRPPPLPTICF
jgi:hypothetical protein